MRNRDRQCGFPVFREFTGIRELAGLRPMKSNEDHPEAGLFDGSKRGSKAWSGFNSLASWEAFCKKGWPEGLAKIRKTIKTIKAVPAQDIRRRGEWAGEGDEVDMGRVYLGSMDTAWRRTRRVAVTGPRVVRIWVALHANASMPAEAFFWPGAAACVVADSLEEAGYSVEIVAYSHGSRTWRGVSRGLVTCCVKGSTEPLNLTRLAATVAHVSTFRVGFFAAFLAIRANADGGLGVANESLPSAAMEPGDVSIKCWDEAGANRAVRNAIKAVGQAK